MEEEALADRGHLRRPQRTQELRCLIYVGSEDVDFREQARRAAPRSQTRASSPSMAWSTSVPHLTRADPLLPAILDTLRGNN